MSDDICVSVKLKIKGRFAFILRVLFLGDIRLTIRWHSHIEHDGPAFVWFQPRFFFPYRLAQKILNHRPHACRHQIFGHDTGPRSFFLSIIGFHSYLTAKIRAMQYRVAFISQSQSNLEYVGFWGQLLSGMSYLFWSLKNMDRWDQYLGYGDPFQ